MVELHKWEDDGGRPGPEPDAGHDVEHDPRVKLALERHGFYMQPGPGGHPWVFAPVGRDSDGSPLTRARMAWPEEARAWREGRLEDIARGLKAEGWLVRLAGERPSLLARLVTALRRLGGKWHG